MPVHGEEHPVAMAVARVGVREAAQLHDRRVEQPDTVLLAQALAGHQLLASRLDAGIAEAQLGHVAQAVPLLASRGVVFPPAS